MDGHVDLPYWFIALVVPVLLGAGAWVWKWAHRSTDGQIAHDRILMETLAVQEARVAQLQSQVDSLERQVVRLREDLHWEREQNRTLRREISFLRVGDESGAAVAARAGMVAEDLRAAAVEAERAARDLKAEVESE